MLVDEQKATSLSALRFIDHYSTKNGQLEKARSILSPLGLSPPEPIAMLFEDELRRVWHFAARIYSIWWCRFWRDQRDAKRRSSPIWPLLARAEPA
jgi:hypothetical protein